MNTDVYDRNSVEFLAINTNYSWNAYIIKNSISIINLTEALYKMKYIQYLLFCIPKISTDYFGSKLITNLLLFKTSVNYSTARYHHMVFERRQMCKPTTRISVHIARQKF